MEIKNDLNVEALDRNIATIHKMRQKSDEKRRWDQKIADHVASFLGRPINLYLHLILYFVGPALIFYRSTYTESDWQVQLGVLGALASAECVFFTIFVLMNQRHMDVLERRNSDLHLQMSMLAEHEITRLIRINDQIAKHLGIKIEGNSKDLEELKKDVNPDQIVEKIFKHEARTPTNSTGGKS